MIVEITNGLPGRTKVVRYEKPCIAGGVDGAVAERKVVDPLPDQHLLKRLAGISRDGDAVSIGLARFGSVPGGHPDNALVVVDHFIDRDDPATHQGVWRTRCREPLPSVFPGEAAIDARTRAGPDVAPGIEQARDP